MGSAVIVHIAARVPAANRRVKEALVQLVVGAALASLQLAKLLEAAWESLVVLTWVAA